MYTSNYASIKKLPQHLRPVSISVGVPKWFHGDVDKRLAPTWAILKKPREIYDELFSQNLSKLNAKQVYEELGDNAVLLCYETHNDWCHRRRVAEWFEQELGIVVPEFGFDREDTFPYALCNEENKGKLRTEVIAEMNTRMNTPVQEAAVVQREPEAVISRRQSYIEKPYLNSLFAIDTKFERGF